MKTANSGRHEDPHDLNGTRQDKDLLDDDARFCFVLLRLFELGKNFLEHSHKFAEPTRLEEPLDPRFYELTGLISFLLLISEEELLDEPEGVDDLLGVITLNHIIPAEHVGTDFKHLLKNALIGARLQYQLIGLPLGIKVQIHTGKQCSETSSFVTDLVARHLLGALSHVEDIVIVTRLWQILHICTQTHVLKARADHFGI